MVTCRMPRLTFDNLPEDKRQRFVAAAVDEFSAHPYRQASITRLVATLNIAKGSVYQYFDNKQALYRWLLTDEVERHRALHLRGTSPDRGDIFGALARYAGANLAFHLAEPKLARLHRFAFAPTRDPDLKALHAKVRRTHLAFFVNFLERGQAAGAIRRDVDLPFAARMVANAVGDGLVDTALSVLGCDLASYLDLGFGDADLLTDAKTETLLNAAVGSVRGAFGTPNAIVGAMESGGGRALGEESPLQLRRDILPAASGKVPLAPLGVIFDDDDAGVLADEWWSLDQ